MTPSVHIPGLCSRDYYAGSCHTARYSPVLKTSSVDPETGRCTFDWVVTSSRNKREKYKIHASGRLERLVNGNKTNRGAGLEVTCDCPDGTRQKEESRRTGQLIVCKHGYAALENVHDPSASTSDMAKSEDGIPNLYKRKHTDAEDTRRKVVHLDDFVYADDVCSTRSTAECLDKLIIEQRNENKRTGIPTLKEMEKHFATEESCARFCIDTKICTPPSQCPRCKKQVAQDFKRQRYRCRNRECRKNGEWCESMYKGTFFEDVKGGRRNLLKFLYFWLSGATSNQLKIYTGWSNDKVLAWTDYIQQLIATVVIDDGPQVGGPGIVVEIDESKFGKRKHHRGHSVEGVWVFGGVELTPERKFFALVVEKRDATTLLPLIRKYIAPGSIIRSDCWGAYNDIDIQEGYEYIHESVNHHKWFRDPNTGVHTNNIEGTWYALKRKTPERKRTKRQTQGCIFEFIFRRNNHGNLWNGLLRALAQVRYQESVESLCAKIEKEEQVETFVIDMPDGETLIEQKATL